MATQEEIEQLRRMTDVDDGDDVYTEEVLSTYIDNLAGNLTAVAAAIWAEKAASYAGLVDVTESGSSRRLSQLHTAALTMAKKYQPDETPDQGGASFTTGMERV